MPLNSGDRSYRFLSWLKLLLSDILSQTVKKANSWLRVLKSWSITMFRMNNINLFKVREEVGSDAKHCWGACRDGREYVTYCIVLLFFSYLLFQEKHICLSCLGPQPSQDLTLQTHRCVHGIKKSCSFSQPLTHSIMYCSRQAQTVMALALASLLSVTKKTE